MYSFTKVIATKWEPANMNMLNLQHKAVAKGVSRTIINRFTHDDYVEMFNAGNLQPVTNRRIQSKLHKVYSLEQTKRGLSPYDDKRYLLADLPNRKPNPNTHAYGRKELANETVQELEVPERPRTDMIIELREKLFFKKHMRVLKKVAARARLNPEGNEDTDNDSEIKLHGDDFDRAERAAYARPGGRRRLDNVIDLITRMNNIRVRLSPPLPISHERAGPSHNNRQAPPTKSRRIVYSSDENAPPPVWPPLAAAAQQESSEDEAPIAEPRCRRNVRHRTNPFIETEAGVDGEASADEDDFDAYPTIGGFFVPDDEFE